MTAHHDSASSPILDDVRSKNPVERLLEDCWDTRSRRMSAREVATEAAATALFLAAAGALAFATDAPRGVDAATAVLLTALYGVASRMIKFPLGVGYVVPSWVVLAPMLLLLPPATVPLFCATGLVLGTLVRCLAHRAAPAQVLFSIPDAWHSVGPALVLLAAGRGHSGAGLALVYVGAFAAACLVDLLSATLREAGALGIRPSLQLRVIAIVWLVDASLAPLGLLFAYAARDEPLQLLLILPLNLLLWLLLRDRTRRIEEARRRLALVARERERLQAAVGRLGEAFAAKLDLDAVLDIVVRASIEAVDADAGRLELAGIAPDRATGTATTDRALRAAAQAASGTDLPQRVHRDGAWALALRFQVDAPEGRRNGTLAVARASRPFSDDDGRLMHDLIGRAAQAAADILAHEALCRQVLTDPLTQLGNRRKLSADLADRVMSATVEHPVAVLLFDLDGFKGYNDAFGHAAGDALLARLGAKLATAVAKQGEAYRLGGDEFCVVVPDVSECIESVLVDAGTALREEGEGFVVTASFGVVLLPHETTCAERALQLADERMYERKHGRGSALRDHTHSVLMRVLQAKEPRLPEHSSGVADLAERVGRRLQMTGEKLDQLLRAAELHDVGKVGIPDAILDKPGSLDPDEWAFMRQHTLLGERILSAAPPMRPVAALVRSSHERWDGAGYPDGLAGEEIPLGSRVIALCDAYEAMTSHRCYRAAMSHEHACAELRREAGRQFDPVVTDLFLRELDTRGGPTVRDARARDVDEVASRMRAVLAGARA